MNEKVIENEKAYSTEHYGWIDETAPKTHDEIPYSFSSIQTR